MKKIVILAAAAFVAAVTAFSATASAGSSNPLTFFSETEFTSEIWMDNDLSNKNNIGEEIVETPKTTRDPYELPFIPIN